MTIPDGAELCPVVIEGPQRRVDIALPVDVPFADMLPAILHYSGRDLADAGQQHGGWILQRLDEAPLEGADTPTQVGLKHGEVLYLRPAHRRLPDVSVQEIHELVADTVDPAQLAGRRWTRAHALGTVAVAAAATVVIVLLAGPPWGPPAVAAGAVALLALLCGAVLSRGPAGPAAANVCALSAAPLAFLAGALPATGPVLGARAAAVATGCAALAVAAVLAAAVMPGGRAVAVAGYLFGVAGVGAGAAGMALAAPRAPAAGVAAVTLAAVFLLSHLLPVAWRWVDRLRLPAVPDRLEESPEETAHPRARELRERLVAGAALLLATVGAAGAIPLALASGWPARLTSVVVAAALFLRARHLSAGAPRLAMMVAGTGALVLPAVGLAGRSAPPAALWGGLVPLLVVAGLIIGVSVWWADHRPAKSWTDEWALPWNRLVSTLDVVVAVLLLLAALGQLQPYVQPG